MTIAVFLLLSMNSEQDDILCSHYFAFQPQEKANESNQEDDAEGSFGSRKR
jgi:hypothetical protein